MLCRRAYSTAIKSLPRIQHDSRIVSGIQPTGIPHIGNYLGFIENFIRIQNDNADAQKFLFLADYHSISVGLPSIGQMDKNVREMTACLLACGVDPQKTILFAQSQISEHTELSWILSSMQSIARLQRLTQFKDKSTSYSAGNIPLGLINYPVLQAADVLLYKGTHVPVGEDQTQHFNLIRQLATKFNNYVQKEFFPTPTMLTSKCPRIKSLRQPTKKMSKSDPSSSACIFVTDSAEIVEEKIRKSVTDSVGTIEFDPVNRPGISNLVQILSAFSNQSIEQVVNDCQNLDTIAFKTRTADAVNSQLEPIRANYTKFTKDRKSVV